MNIPLDFIKDITPNLIDPLSKSTVYTFFPGSHVCNEVNELLFKFPYSENTYWTHFKYTTSMPNTLLYAELLIITDKGQDHVILPLQLLQPSTWHNTVWPLPSVNTSISAIYLKIKPSSENLDIILYLSGFVDLLPSVDGYIISAASDIPVQLVISRKHNTIHSLEDYDTSQNTLVVTPLKI